MSDRAKETVEGNGGSSPISETGVQELSRSYHALAGMSDERVRGWLLEALAKRAEQAEQSEPEPDEIEARALLDSFDGRITEIERRIDRVLARLAG